MREVDGFIEYYALRLADDEDAEASATQAVGRAKKAGGHGGPGPVRVETHDVIRHA